MAKKGLMIDYLLCTGCHSCEVSCKLEKNLPTGEFGIKLAEDKPWQIDDDTWEYKWIPVPTQLCDLCEDRIAKGKLPSCVQCCQAKVLEYGTIEECGRKLLDKPRKAAVFVP